MQLSSFPSAYQSLISGFSGTVYYISDADGSDSNNGTSISTPWKTYAYARAQTYTNTGAVMFVFDAGTYTDMVTVDSFTTCALYDYGYARTWVGSPGRTIITGTPGAERDHPIIQYGSSSAIYGCILQRNNNGRTTNYTVALFRGNPGSTRTSGSMYNCVIREINSNGDWSLQYDNNANSTGAVNNCLFYFTEVGAADYSGSSGFVVSNSAFTHTWGTGNATKTNTDVGVTIANTSGPFAYSITSNNTTKGVWSGTYKWEPPASMYFANSTANNITWVGEGATFKAVLDTNGVNVYNSIPYTITGISANDINIGLTGSITSNATGFATLNITTSADYPLTEGTETITIQFGNTTIVPNQPSASIYLYDTSSVLHVEPGSDISTGDTVKIVLITSGETNGQTIPYTISGATSAQLNGSNTSGDFTIQNNTANLTLQVVGVVNSNVTVSAYGSNTSFLVSFTKTLTANVDSNYSSSWYYPNDKLESNNLNYNINARINSAGDYTANANFSVYVPDSSPIGTTEKEYWS